MVRFIDEVDCPAVRANIDISHLCLAKVPAAEVRRLKGKAIHVHISDCDGKVHGDLPPGRGVVDFVLPEALPTRVVDEVCVGLLKGPYDDGHNQPLSRKNRPTLS